MIKYSVDLLSESEKISNTNELYPLKYGVIVRYKNKWGLLLPNLEGVNSINEQFDIALKKANIKSNEPYEIERFLINRNEK